MPAPQNPYRPRDEEAYPRGWASLSDSRVVARPQREDLGPGMTADDLDRMCHQHFADGYAAAERVGEERLERERKRHAAIYDEGYDARSMDEARRIAREARLNLYPLSSRLDHLEEQAPPPKRLSKAHAATLGEVERARQDLRHALARLVEVEAGDADTLMKPEEG